MALLSGFRTAFGAPPLRTQHMDSGNKPMSGYTITITSDSTEENTTITGSQTTIKVDTSSGEPRIAEVTIRSLAPGGLPTDRASVLSVVDLDLLVHALTSGTAKPKSAAGSVSAAEPITTLDSQQSEAGATPPAPARKKSANRSDRTYRRMPDTADVLAAYERIGTITGMAEHFSVPRYTAQGWMTRIRKQDDKGGQPSAR